MKIGTNALQKIGSEAAKAAVKTGLKIRKASPELMLAGGILAGATAIVTACIAMKKTVEENDIQAAHDELDEIQKTENKPDESGAVMDEKAFRKLMNRKQFRV